MTTIALTGAAGRLGSWLREPLTALCDQLISSDIVDDIGSLYPKEIYRKADLADFEQVQHALEGADYIIHFGAYADEAPFNTLLGPNFIGSYNVWESGFQLGAKRIIYASSIHAVGMHSRTEGVDIDSSHRPDTFYGLSKCFTEDLGRMYFDKRGLESVHLRILSCAQVNNDRALGTWLSYSDLIHLVTQAINTPVTGFQVIYGVSDNDRSPVDNRKANYLGYRPKDNAEQFAEQILKDTERNKPLDVGQTCLGGPFAKTPLGESGVAQMNIIDDRKESEIK